MTLIKVNYDLLSNFIMGLKLFASSLFQNTDFYLKKNIYTGRYGSGSTTRSSTRHFRNILHPDYKNPENESLINKKSKLEIDLYKGAVKDEKNDLSQAIAYNNELQLVVENKLLQLKI
jgi:hypothetical protein